MSGPSPRSRLSSDEYALDLDRMLLFLLRKSARTGEAASMLKVWAVFTLLLIVVLRTSAQDSEQAAAKRKKATSGELFETIAAMDATVFDAFNQHDLERLMSMFTDDLEFYDDGSGVKSHAQTKDDFAKVFERVPDLRREVVKSSLEVYPLQGYGAIEVGEHRFCHEENGKPDCGVMKFSMVWRQTGDKWQLARVLSYAH